MRTVFQTKRPNAAAPALVPLLMAVTTAMALTFVGCELGTPADFLRDSLAVVTVQEVQARQRAVVTETGADIGRGTSVIALKLDNSRKIPIKLNLNPPITDDGHISWEVAQNGAQEALVTIKNAVLGDELSVTLCIGAKGRDFPPYTFTVRCTAAAGGDIWNVTFDTRGQGAIPPQPVSGGSILGYPEPPVYPDYYLAGWYRDSACTDGMRWDFVSDIVTGNITLYAKWARTEGAITYTVTFDANGNGAATATSPQTVFQGSPVTRPFPPTAPGWSFGGWYTDKGCTPGTEWDFSTAVLDTNTQDGTLTLYAQWATSYTVTFHANGHGTATAPQTVAPGGPLNNPISPIETNMAFAGWYRDSDCTPGKEWDFDADTVDGDIDLYAKWTYLYFKVTFDANGHGTDPALQTLAAGAPVSKPGDLSALGWDFGGWYEDTGCTDEKEWTFSTPVNDTKAENGTLTLFAKWTDQNSEDFAPGAAITAVRNISSDATELNTYLNSIRTVSGNYVINLPGDKRTIHKITAPISLTGGSGKTISLRGNTDDRIEVTGYQSGLFELNTDVKLILRGPTLVGTAGSNAAVVSIGNGEFHLKSGAITGNENTFTFTDRGGGGVEVNSGIFIMSGGTIGGNKADKGGGVYVSPYTATFIMEGGTISGNFATNALAGGGGVYVDSNLSFKKTGGTIAGTGAPDTNRVLGVGVGSAVCYNAGGVNTFRNTTAEPKDKIDIEEYDQYGDINGFWQH